MSAPAHYRFTPSHEWIASGEAIATVGISQHAQAELGDVVYIELPQVGRVVKAKDPVAVIESVKAASDIYAPVDGEIAEVNSAVSSDTSLVNSDPYGAGWLFKIKLANPDDAAALMDEDHYLGQIG